jgi:uncharacterized protein YjbI with pentapeptide repeats
MPYTPPARTNPSAEQVEETALPADDQHRASHPLPGQNPAQELQVRQAAQRVLARHLRLPHFDPLTLPRTRRERIVRATRNRIVRATAQRHRPSPRRPFWPGISLDLGGATLVDVDFSQLSVIQAQFDGAVFQGGAWFAGASFQEDASFAGATFQGSASFPAATFQGQAWFAGAVILGQTWFAGAIVQEDASFVGAVFQRSASFGEAVFQGSALFGKATFQGPADFAGAIFQEDAWFGDATFQDEAEFGGAHVLHLDNPPPYSALAKSAWEFPEGYIIHRDPADRIRSTLVYAEQAEEPDPAVPPVGPTDNGPGTG